MRTTVKNLARKIVEELADEYENYMYLCYGDIMTNKTEVIDDSTKVLIGWLESFDTDVLEDFVKAKHDEHFDEVMGDSNYYDEEDE